MCVCTRARGWMHRRACVLVLMQLERVCACARVAFLIQHATRRHIAICCLSGTTIFFGFFSQNARFSEKKVLIIKCVFWFSLELLPKIFYILKRILRDLVINVNTPSCKVPAILSDFKWYFNFVDRFSKKKGSSIKLHENPSSGSRVVPCRHTYIQWRR